VSATEFVTAVMNGLADDVPEIGYGMTDGFFRASRADLDRSFEQINSRR
jgi:short-subunit dehydrogenase involved in D-alanine esterification of teichoic acids